MTLSFPKTIAALVTLLVVLGATAQTVEDAAARLSLEPPGSPYKDRFGLSYHMGLNIAASFHHLGGYSSLNPARTPDNRDPYNYDNGYIYPDATTANAHPGYTWYYGYVPGTPVRQSEFDFYRATSPANASSRDNGGDPQHGVELTYNRQLGRVGRGGWGLELAAGFTDLTIRDERTLHAAAVRRTDTYASGGGAVLDPGAPPHPFEGPGPNDPNGWPLVALSAAGSSSESFAGDATITGYREFDAQIFSFRLGPYLDLPISERLLFTLSGGLLLLQVNSDFRFDENVSLASAVTLAPLPSEHHHGSASASDLLAGGYVSGAFSYAVSDRVRLFAGAQFQTTQDYEQTVAGKKAVLSLGQAVYVDLGFSYSF